MSVADFEQREEERRTDFVIGDYTWFLVMVPSGKEDIAIELFEQRGLWGYRPPKKRRLKLWRGAQRRTVKYTAEMPRYIFVGLPDGADREDIRQSVPFQVKFVKTGDKVKQLQEDVVIWARDIAGMEVSHAFSTGDTVELKAGPFKGCSGTVEGLTGNPKTGALTVWVSIHAFNQQTPAGVTPETLARV